MTARRRRTTGRIEDAMLGTHVVRSSRAPRRANADAVDFSSSRKSQRATRGYVDTIVPQTSSRESSSRHARRMAQRDYMRKVQRARRVRTVAVVAVCIVAALCVAGVAGVGAFLGSVNGKLALDGSDAADVLAEPDDEGVFYLVVSADLDLTDSATSLGDGPDAFALVRVDADAQRVAVVSFPANTSATLSAGDESTLRDLAAAEGDAALISAITEAAGVEVSHFVTIDAEGIVGLVDALGGIEVELAEEVDDPAAGDVYLPAGEQTLDGASALVLLRASNYADSVEVQCAAQRSALVAVAQGLMGSGPVDFLTSLSDYADYFQTDLKANEARALAGSLRGGGTAVVDGALAAGSATTGDDGQERYVVSSSGLEEMIERAEEGEALEEAEEEVELVDPGSFTVIVRNGAGITGAASSVAEGLTELGFEVADTGNTDSFVYTETLIIYSDDDNEACAYTVLDALGAGRVVDGGDYYTFSSDVLVVVGEDWMPAG